ARSTEQLYKGVTYIKEVRTDPRDMVIHILKINVARGGIRPLVTPPDRPKSDQPYNARTTSEFAKKFKLQLAINGGGFRPWYDYKLFYFPHSGDKVSPLGTTISENFSFNASEDQELPLLMFGGTRPVEIGYIASKAEYAVSGTRLLVDNGEITEGLDSRKLAPRTTAGVDKKGQTLIIVIVDGRQSGYSKGITLKEIAQILLENGAERALELDGGGSSTLVLNRDGNPVVLNSPVHRGIPGIERPVATHIGFSIK
ncbi:MAG TPA: hypothetical protein DCY42_04510, partial [Chloroflexi bacterium]|nr:hypothetical protein [Chloroflexota bacterium]